ncbi:HD-GYP domain-containing protein [Alkalicoccus chagannorensis]|uniref:HD-GYP domain-containing protein n=1 Tax=Alkalicoccus chagannorensis TaxID=427072 RepID=UPI001FE16DE7|nr:HD-GYP domain-containing protein [Alkalicoccus chagannorensis]
MPLHRLKQDEKLAKAIYKEDGRPLLQIGAVLTERLVERLEEKGVTFVYVQEPGTEDIEAEDAIDPRIRAASIKTIRENFENAGKQLALGKSVNIDDMSVSFSSIVDQVMQEILHKKEAVTLLSDVVAHDTYVFHHSLNVAVYALSLGKSLGLNQEELHKLGMGAVLHDVGKMSLPLEVLKKPGKLTDEEFQIIKHHTTAGFDILRNSHTISLLTAHCAYQHHERLDGSGYPRSLNASDIHAFAKIIAIADVFDAVTSHRSYRQAMLPHEGLEVLYSGAGTQFDQKMVETFSRTVAVYPPGLEVELNGGRTGIITQKNTGIPQRPLVRITHEEGVPVTAYEVDLSEDLSSMIVSCETALDQRTGLRGG